MWLGSTCWVICPWTCLCMLWKYLITFSDRSGFILRQSKTFRTDILFSQTVHESLSCGLREHCTFQTFSTKLFPKSLCSMLFNSPSKSVQLSECLFCIKKKQKTWSDENKCTIIIFCKKWCLCCCMYENIVKSKQLPRVESEWFGITLAKICLLFVVRLWCIILLTGVWKKGLASKRYHLIYLGCYTCNILQALTV